MIKDSLIQYIKLGNNVEFLYDGKKRIVCPHLLCQKDQEVRLFGVQYGGISSQPLPPNGDWRCFFISRIYNLKKLDDNKFYNLASSSKFTTCCDNIIVKNPQLK